LVTAEGKVAWVAEVTSEATAVVAYAADGTELGTDQLPGLSGDAEGSEEGFTEVGEAVEDTIPADGPTTTGG
jgi:hypothetical protein